MKGRIINPKLDMQRAKQLNKKFTKARIIGMLLGNEVMNVKLINLHNDNMNTILWQEKIINLFLLLTFILALIITLALFR